MLKANNYKIKRDVAIIAISFVIAFFLWQNQIIDELLGSLSQGRLISAFVGGFFFTSIFTTIPAMVFLVKLAQFNNIVIVALIGAAGAVVGDSIIFYFVRDRLFNDLVILTKKTRRKRFKHFFKSKIIRLSLAIAGGLLIALPLFPDETALALLGMSKIATRLFIIIAFTFNFLAIYLLALAAKSLM